MRKTLLCIALLALPGCTMPQTGNLTTSSAAVVGNSGPSYPAVVGPKVWASGQYGFRTRMFWVGDQYGIMLQQLNPPAQVVERCYHLTWGKPERDREDYRTCIALDYMLHRDQRFHARARQLAQDPYFSEDAFGARMDRMVRWGGFASADDLFEFCRIAWSYAEPAAIDYLHKQNLHYLG